MYAMRNPSHACGVDFFIGIVFLHIMRSFYFSSLSSLKYLLRYNALAPLLFPQLVSCEFSNLCFMHLSIFFCLVSDTICIVVVARNTIFCSGLGYCLSSFSVFPIVLRCLQNIIGAPHEYYMSVRSLRPSSEWHKCP